jgi:hypothetical protein
MVGFAAFCGSLLGLWRLEGRPEGFERRLLRLIPR